MVRAGWIYGFLGILLGCLAGYVMLDRGWLRAARSLSVPVQQSADISQPKALATANAETPGDVLVKPDLHGAERANGNVGRNDTGRSNRAGSAQYRVFSLSDAQTSQLESACSSQKELHGQAAYQACVKAQLDLITNASSPPDLSALSTAERESLESVCSETKRRRGVDAYNRCRNAQMAGLAAEPSRPDLSTLSEGDRNSIESACRNTKYREGPSAYDRCLMRFTKLLAESK
jgi:D-serine deaminase-like pyridoxal phosphate-dependent protein